MATTHTARAHPSPLPHRLAILNLSALARVIPNLRHFSTTEDLPDDAG